MASPLIYLFTPHFDLRFVLVLSRLRTALPLWLLAALHARAEILARSFPISASVLEITGLSFMDAFVTLTLWE